MFAARLALQIIVLNFSHATSLPTDVVGDILAYADDESLCPWSAVSHDHYRLSTLALYERSKTVTMIDMTGDLGYFLPLSYGVRSEKIKANVKELTLPSLQDDNDPVELQRAGLALRYLRLIMKADKILPYVTWVNLSTE